MNRPQSIYRILLRGTREMKNKRIAVFGNGWSNEYLQMFLEGVRAEAKKDNVDIFVYLTYIFWSETLFQHKCQLNIFHLPNPKDYDGAIVLTNTFNIPDERERVCALFQRAGVPMISTEVELPDMAYIGTSNYEGFHDLAKHVVEEHGARDIVYVAGIEGHPECAIRRKALEDVLAEHDLKLKAVIHGEFGFTGAANAVRDYFNKGGELPDAFVCANDHEAIGVSTTLDEMGYKVPEQVIVTGFDNIDEARTAFPMIATVSRRWDLLGKHAYNALKDQIEHQDPSFHVQYPSEFIPNESCGCKATKKAADYRLNRFRNSYFITTQRSIMDIFFQNLRVAMSKVESKEEFNQVASDIFGREDYLGPDFAFCIEPAFFELDDDKYPQRIRGYSKTMDVLYEKRGGKSVPLYSFRTNFPVPHYHKDAEGSNTYYFLPLNNQDYIIGYLVIKNSPELLYNLELRIFLSNLDSMFITIRQYIFAQENNRKLKQIYMTDFLTNMYNRMGCEKVMFSSILKAQEENRSSILLFADINRMKTINDRYGHLNGDLAIKATADAMKHSLPDSWMFGRYGGDEFVAVGPCTHEDKVLEMRQKLDEDMNAYIEGLNLAFPLSVSVGFSIIHPDDAGEISDFIQCADDSMYEEKEKAHKIIDALNEDTK